MMKPNPPSHRIQMGSAPLCLDDTALVSAIACGPNMPGQLDPHSPINHIAPPGEGRGSSSPGHSICFSLLVNANKKYLY